MGVTSGECRGLNVQLAEPKLKARGQDNGVRLTETGFFGRGVSHVDPSRALGVSVATRGTANEAYPAPAPNPALSSQLQERGTSNVAP